MKSFALAVVAALCCAPQLFAHDGVEHLRGTVTQMTATAITIAPDQVAAPSDHGAAHNAQAGQPKTILLTVAADTTFVKSGAPAGMKDLKVGDKVVVDAVATGRQMTAKAVRFGPSKPAQTAPAAHNHSH